MAYAAITRRIEIKLPSAHVSWRGPKLKKTPIFLLMPNSHKLRKDSKNDLGVFWPFRATDFIMGILKIWDNFLGPHGPILKFTFLESLRNLWLFGINKKDGCFFSV